jgi:putative transposase
MRGSGLAAVQPRAYKRTTLPGDAPAPVPDLLAGDFTATEPGAQISASLHARSDGPRARQAR